MYENLQPRIEAIKAKYQPEIDAIQKDGEQLKNDVGDPNVIGATIGVDFDVDWKDQEIIFDIPSVTMKRQEISLDIPEFIMEQQHVSFDVPETRMVDRVVGRYPEVHGFTIRWKDIIVSVPEVVMVRKDIFFGTPSVTMRRHDMSWDVPEFTMERIRLVIGLPQFIVKNVKGDIQMVEEKGKKLGERGNALAEAMKSEINQVIAEETGGAVGNQNNGAVQAAAMFDPAIIAMQGSIDQMVALGVDPVAAPVADGSKRNLRKELADLIEQKKAIIGQIDQKVASAYEGVPTSMVA